MIEIFNKINDIPNALIENWNALNISIEQKSAWLKTAETLLSNSIRYYIFDHDQNSIKTFIIGTLVNRLDCLNFIVDNDVRDEIIKQRVKNPNTFYYDVLFIGIPMSNYSGIIKSDDNIEIREILSAASKKLKGIDAVFYTSLDKNINSNKYDIVFPYYPNTRLDLEFESFRDYLNSLKKKKRWDLKNKRKIFLDSKANTKLIDNENMDKEVLRRLYSLYHSTESKNEKNINYITYDDKDKFASFLKLKSNYKWLIAYDKDDSIIGFALLVIDRNTLMFKNVGIDYSCNETLYTYFNLYYCAIEYAISISIKTMFCGTTTYDIKRRLGCELIYRNAALDIRSTNRADIEKLKRMFFVG